MSLTVFVITLVTLTSPSTSLYYSPSPPAAPFNSSSSDSSSSSSSSSYVEWLSAHATCYTAADSTDTLGGACGHSDGYGVAAATGLSEALFERGQICGACFELRCAEEESPFDRRWCILGRSVIVTATDFCAPNYGFDADGESGGGRCNPPKQHFVVPLEAFEKIAIWKGGNLPVQYRR